MKRPRICVGPLPAGGLDHLTFKFSAESLPQFATSDYGTTVTVHSIASLAPWLRSALAGLETVRGQSLDAREKAVVAEQSAD
jgi:hypothetical protein